MKSSNRFVWIDLEMTGLNPEQDTILEIASIITDDQLNFIAAGPELIIHQPDTVLYGMGKWCREQHAKSGLIKASQESTITIQEAEKQTFAFIQNYCEENTGLLSGNSVWQDRAFLRVYMPKIIHYLHYKLIDVSSIKELVLRWYPNSKYAEFKKQETHRALADIQESIEELRHYRKYFFTS